MGPTRFRQHKLWEVGRQDNGNESKANIPTTNVNTSSVARQEEGARIINMCFANAPVAVAA